MKRFLLVTGLLLAPILGLGAWFLWVWAPRPALPALPATAGPRQVVERFVDDFGRNRPADGYALMAPVARPGYRVDWLHNDPLDWRGHKIASVSSTGDHDNQYWPYEQVVTVEVDFDRTYHEGESNDFGPGDRVVLYFTVGCRDASDAWRILDVEDNDV